MDWDNVGHLLGDPDQAVTKVCVALDITEAVAAEAIEQGCELIVSHHPVMTCKWLPVQTVRSDTAQGHLLLRLLRSGVAAICMHTNLDVAPGGVNDAFAAALGWRTLGPWGTRRACAGWERCQVPCPYRTLPARSAAISTPTASGTPGAESRSAAWRWAAAPARTTSATPSPPGATPS